MVVLIVVLPTTIVPAQSTTKFRNTSCSRTKILTKNGTVASIDRFTNNRTSDQRYGSISKSTTLLKESTFSGHHTSYTHECGLQQLVKKIRDKMTSRSSEYDEVEELIMIDAIQRLGLEYYFHDDINAVLERQHVQFITMGENGSNLHDVALRFRLLRKAGYKVSADMFDAFKNKNGTFRNELCGDMRGLLSLFEASQMSIPRDHTLEDAGEFCEKFLKNTLKNAGVQSEARIIGKTLSNPYHKSLPRLITKNDLNDFDVSIKILHDCSGMTEWIKEVQDLARIDVNVAQTNHKNEITRVSRWWNDLSLTENLNLARSEPVKWHMWSLVVLPGPNMAELRTELTKSISFIYLIDDIFDVYGTLEELTLFTDAVYKWDYANITGLPDYMQMCFKALYNTTNEISNKIYMKHGWNPEDYLQKAWAELCSAFLVEARWFATGHLPSTEDYLKNGIVSSGVYVVSATVFSLLGEAIDHRTTDLLNSHPDIVSSAAKILRLWDDLGACKDENQDGHDGSFIACYMNQHEDSSAESAQEYVLQMISDAWKCLNEGCLSHSPLSADYKAAILNLARMVPIMYSYDENHNLPTLENHMKSLLHE